LGPQKGLQRGILSGDLVVGYEGNERKERQNHKTSQPKKGQQRSKRGVLLVEKRANQCRHLIHESSQTTHTKDRVGGIQNPL